MPTISVVIPTYCRPEPLKRAIASVLAQTFTDLEVIVVRDGIDQTSVEAVESFADARLRVIALEEKVGGAEARNLGARAAVGRWIALLDDDDEWMPDKLARQHEIACGQRDDCYVVGCRYLYVLGRQAPQIWPGQMPRKGTPLSEFLFAPRGGFQTSVYLVPRQLMLDKPFTSGLKKHQDWDWFLRLAVDPRFRALWCEEPLSIYYAQDKAGRGVSSTIDWKWSAGWAKSNLSSMTRRAYSMFLVRICFRAAAEANAPAHELLGLVREMLFVGRVNSRLLIETLAALLLKPQWRRKLSAWAAPMRQARASLLS